MASASDTPLATRLVNELVEAADEKQRTKTINRYELDRRGAELLFHVLTEREEKNSIAIASNQSFSAWTDTFTDPRLCAAIVDRLTYNATIIETGTNSYRLAHTRAKASVMGGTTAGWALGVSGDGATAASW